MACLLDFAFRKLIGVRGASPGMRTIKRMVSPSLIGIAPAVWDLRYLQTISVHAHVIPSIAAGIARLGNAQSSSLREKLDLLIRHGRLGGDNPHPVDAEVDATDEVKKRLWSLCQTHIRPEPMKGPYAARKVVGNATEQPPSQLVLAGRELETSPHCMEDFDSNVLIDREDYELVAEPDDDYSGLPEVLPELNHHEAGSFLQTGEFRVSEERELSLDEWTHSSEGDYFYTDGQGNVYPVDREAVPEDGRIDWPSTPQLLNSEVFSHEEEEEEVEVLWDGDANQTYIMYHEVQPWPPLPEAHIHAEDAAGQLRSLPHLDDAPFNGWDGD
ncbi:hypothetical protein C8A00DRAFT_42920 [Chaetomidium leptoderma]|uniref:Uncharacterized protein n=1 Tax=Chaetomidium leptoderma TaxID=669021 RepID=A0AAN6VN72_9PEZI|nr:hypothetical protein C8A00DRAFT_42920 [Chaetomidium leptoderma]